MTHTNEVRNREVRANYLAFGCIRLFMFLSAQTVLLPLLAQTDVIQPVDADTLHFTDEYQFRDFLVYHDLKHYSIKPQVDFYDCTVNPGTTIYTDQHDDDFLHEERFIGKPLIFIVDHNGTRKIYHILIPSTGDTTLTTCDVQLTLTNPVTGQVVVFDDVYNWIDENGRNIFNMNKKMYFLWGFDSGNVDFPAEMLQLTTGVDFTFPDYFPEDTGPIHLIMSNIDMYTQYTYYADMDGDGYGDLSNDTMDYAAPPGFVENADDCDDNNPAVFPGASEVLNALDDDCNGVIDDFPGVLCYQDEDEDGYGNEAVWAILPELTTGYALIAGDCDDTEPGIHPASVELCNGLDDNCTGTADEEVITAATTPFGTVSMCAGSFVTLYATEDEDFNYSWRKNGLEIPGETSASLNVIGSGNYAVMISVDEGCSALSDEVFVTLNSLPNAVITAVTDLDLCTAPGIGVAKLRTSAPAGASIQWLKDGAVVYGATTKSRTFNEAGAYQSMVTNLAGCSTVSDSVIIFNSCREGSHIESDSDFLVYPNPANSQFLVQAFLSPDNSDAVLEIYNLQGNCLFTKLVDVEDGCVMEWIDVRSLSTAGAYIVQLHAGDEVFSQLMMVNH